MSLNHKIEIVASLTLNEKWLDNDAVEGLSIAEIKKLGMELIQEDFGAFCEDAKWSVSVEYNPDKRSANEPK